VSLPDEIRLGTRGSQLALWQAHAVAARIADAGGPPCRIVTITTSGDRLQQAPVSQVGGKRLFVKEIEDALLRNEIDVAVHSSKDMPAVLPEGLAIAGVLPREDPLDAVVLGVETVRSLAVHADHVTTIEHLVSLLGETPAIGTGSVRRVAQLTRLFPSARFTPIRGNLDTRLRKLDAGEYDAIVLAAAGLRRLGFASRIYMALPVEACVPAPGQGIIAVQTRSGDEALRQMVEHIDDLAAHAALDAERALVKALGGGCQTPIGALAVPIEGELLELVASVVTVDGSRAVHARSRGLQIDAAALGGRVGAQLLDEGAGEILAEAQRAQGAVEGIQP
jgi:hydroxymethylbilane synthase